MFTGLGLVSKAILGKFSTRVFSGLAGDLRSIISGGAVGSSISVAFCEVRNVSGTRIPFVVLGWMMRDLKSRFLEIGFCSGSGVGCSRSMVVSAVNEFWSRASW